MMKILLWITLFFVYCISLLSQELPEFTFTDLVGDVTPASVDLVGGWFVQQGDSLLIGYQMAAPFADRPIGLSLCEFYIDTDCDPHQYWKGENNVDFYDYGGGNWFGSMYLLRDQEKSTFTNKVLVPTSVTDDGKSMFCKISLVGMNWSEIKFTFNGWYKTGLVGYQVPHWNGDAFDNSEWTPCELDPTQITALEDREGINCIIKVPESYSASADAKNITGAVDEMVNWVRSKIGTIYESEKKFSVEYENFTDYAHPMVQWSGTGNQFGCRIPGQYWVDEPNWFAMLHGVINQTLLELSDGLEQVFLVQSAYQRPIPIDGEGWYCTKNDSINGFKFTTNHKWSFKALMGVAYENCFTFYIAENLSDGEAKTSIINKKAEMETSWTNFSGTAEELTPEIMTGLLLSLSDDLSWTERIYKNIIPRSIDIEDEDTTAFDRILNNYILNPAYSPTLWDSVAYYTQQHLGWYPSIASVQAAVIDVATGGDIYSALQVIGYPLEHAKYADVKSKLTETTIDNEPKMPVCFKLFQNYPNPFNPLTNIVFEIPEESRVSLVIYDLAGRTVWEMPNSGMMMSPGQYTVQWSGRNRNNVPVATGIYFIRFMTPQYNQTRKVIIMK
ncbi:MAG: T9SS type A sorting domain-containing protein [Candidatus Neomarinimicrobiota bacterium]|jgi:hypothetical protein